MQGLKYIQKEIPILSSLETIAHAYEESSIFKIQQIRSGVLGTREYLTGLSQVYFDIKYSEALQKKERVTRDGKHPVPASTKIQKTLIVLLSAGAKLYGDIIQDVFDEFLKAVKQDGQADVMVVGRLGEEMFKNAIGSRQHLFFEVPDVNLQARDLEPIIYHIVRYERVMVFHGKFFNLMTQKPSILNISGETMLGEDKRNSTQKIRFLFEPSLDKLVTFFETQIFATLFNQTVHESELARYASRVTAMEESLQFIKRRKKELFNKRGRLRRVEQQKKQLERISGMRLWNN